MLEDMIGMTDMIMVYEVTDKFDLDREKITVPLGKEDPGEVRLLKDGIIEIVIPLSTSTKDWLSTLHSELEKFGLIACDSE